MAGLSTILGIVGGVVQAVGTIAAGQAERQAADYEAAQLDVRAKEEKAAAFREAEEVARRRRLVLSQVQSRAAASGLGPTDDTVLNIESEIAGYGAEQEGAARAVGVMRERGLKAQAAATRASGRAAATGSAFAAGGTILGSFVNAFSQKYGDGGYKRSNPYGTMAAYYG